MSISEAIIINLYWRVTESYATRKNGTLYLRIQFWAFFQQYISFFSNCNIFRIKFPSLKNT